MEVLSSKQLRQLVVSNLAGTLGSAILTFVIGLMILKQSDSALYFGLSQAIGPLVSVCLLPITGSLVDKYDKKTIILIGQIISVVALLLFAGYLTFFNPEGQDLVSIFLLLITLKISDQFLSTASLAAATSLVIESHVQKLKSIEQTISALSQLVAPIVGTLLYASLHLDLLIGLEIACELLVFFIVGRLNFHLVPQQALDSQEGILTLFKEGVSFIQSKPKMRHTLLLFMFVNFMITGVIIGLPYVQISLLSFPDLYYGLTEAALSLGFILVGIYLATRAEIHFPLLLAWKSIIAIGFLVIIIGLSLLIPLSTTSYFAIFLVLNLICGCLSTAVNIPMMTWVTKVVPQHYQGRIFNLVQTFSQLLTPLGMVLFSKSFDWLPASLLFLLTGLLIAGVTAYWPSYFKINMSNNTLED